MPSFRRFAFVALLVLSAGCETPDEDYPSGAETIRIGVARFGEPVAVTIGQRTEEWEFCHPRMGEFGPWIDCEDSRERAAEIVSIECVPAASCRDVVLDGARGAFFPLDARFSVKVVGEIEGSRIETTREVSVAGPAVNMRFSPEHALPDTKVSICRSHERDVAIAFAVTLDGAPLTPLPDDPARRGCTSFVPPSPGTLRAVPHLLDPGVDLQAITAEVHPFSDVDDVAIDDWSCRSSANEVGAYLGEDGRYVVAVGATGTLHTSPSSTQSAAIPASRFRLVDGDLVLTPRAAPAELEATFVLDAPPSSARIEVDLDGRITTAPVRTRVCR